MDAGAKTHVEREEILLIDRSANLHLRRVDYLHEGDAGVNLIAFLDLAHLSFFPNGVEHNDAVYRRANLHDSGIGLGMIHHLLRAVTLNVKQVNSSLRSLTLQVERCSKLL